MFADVFATCRNLATSRARPARFVRIAILAALGWWGLDTVRSFEANTPVDKAWPRTDFSRTTVDLREIMSGGPPKDGIPAIDNPRFDSVKEANEWLDPREPVIVVSFGDDARAYPLQILIFHEIVNDMFGDQPIAVTFCPLCNASIVFDRRVEDTTLDFRSKDGVVQDSQTQTRWNSLGQGVGGPLAGRRLKPLDGGVHFAFAWLAFRPDSEIYAPTNR